MPIGSFKLTFKHFNADAQLLHLSMSLGGFGWIPNLTVVDQSFILPVVMVVSNLAIIQVKPDFLLRKSQIEYSDWIFYAVASVNKSHSSLPVWSRGHQCPAGTLPSHATNSILCSSCKFR